MTHSLADVATLRQGNGSSASSRSSAHSLKSLLEAGAAGKNLGRQQVQLKLRSCSHSPSIWYEEHGYWVPECSTRRSVGSVGPQWEESRQPLVLSLNQTPANEQVVRRCSGRAE